MFDIYTIIFLALAVFIFLRLRSVLGQRTGEERPPFDIKAARDAMQAAAKDAKDNVIPLNPAQTNVKGEGDSDEVADRWKGIAAPGSVLATGLDAVAAQDRDFDARHFLTGARGAYEMIVTAFAEGDRRALKDLLSAEVYQGFENAIRDREARGETMETRFVSIDRAELTGAELKGRNAQIVVRFVSQIVSATRDKDGNIVDGSADKVTDVTDVWTFSRDVTARDPNWKLVGTEAAE